MSWLETTALSKKCFNTLPYKTIKSCKSKYMKGKEGKELWHGRTDCRQQLREITSFKWSISEQNSLQVEMQHCKMRGGLESFFLRSSSSACIEFCKYKSVQNWHHHPLPQVVILPPLLSTISFRCTDRPGFSPLHPIHHLLRWYLN